MSRILMIYYSLEGNTEFAAQTAAENAEIDLERLIPAKEPPKKGFRKFMWGGSSVVFGETPALDPLKYSADDYEHIIVGFPVWASSFPPAINTYIKEHPFTGKKVDIIACSAGGSCEKAVNKLIVFHPQRERFAGRFPGTLVFPVRETGNRAKRIDLGDGKSLHVMKYYGKYQISYLEGTTLIQKEYQSLKGINNFANKYGVNFVQEN